jgi:biotin carboxyl carrier protein
VLEAMKMENEIYAPKSGRIRKMYVKEGENVEESQLL